MHFDNKLTNRVAALFEKQQVKYEAKKMFGGICFLVDDKMCVGSREGRLMVRFDPVDNDKVMAMEGTSPMDFTNKVMKGFVFVTESAVKTDEALSIWLDMALEYNPRAKSSKKKSKK